MNVARTVRLAALTLVVALALNLSPARAQSAQPTKVATANPAKVFQQLQETTDLKAAIENKLKVFEQQKFEKQQKLKELEAQRNLLKPDAPAYQDKQRELLQASMEFQVWGQMFQADLQREQKMQMKTLFDKITASVTEVATQKGIDLVIAEQRPELDNIDQLNIDQVRALLSTRNVLFSVPQIDISNDVIAAMDARYKSGK